MLDVAVNPAVLKESETDKTEIYMLALSFAQQQHGMRLSPQYTVVSCSPKSSPDDLHRRLGFRQWPNASKQPDTGTAISLTPAISCYKAFMFELFPFAAAGVSSFTFCYSF